MCFNGPMAFNYPAAPRVNQVDDYHGVTIADPFRILEDPHHPDTRTWIDQQVGLTRAYLEGLPLRSQLRQRMEQLFDYPRWGVPQRHGDHYFFTHNPGLQNQDTLYVGRQPTEGRVLLDPNTLSTDGTVALHSWYPSPDGRWLAYALAQSGSDWLEWHVREVETGIDLPDRLHWSKFSGAAWLPDSSGFYYSRYQAPQGEQAHTAANFNQQLCLHRLGRIQEADELIYERPDHPDWGFQAEVTEDGRYLLLQVWKGTQRQNLVFWRPLQGQEPFGELVNTFEASYNFLTNQGSRFYFQTDHQAPRGKVVAVDLAQPDPQWYTVVDQQEDTLQQAVAVGNGLALVFLHHAHSRLCLYHPDRPHLEEVPLPGLGTVGAVWARAGEPELFLSFTSFLAPALPYRLDWPNAQLHSLHPGATRFDPQQFEARQVFVTSKDGTQVPLFLVHRKGLKLTADHPVLLYGYGGFNIPMTPNFSATRLVWLEQGGVYAQACLRGGGEYGQQWHRAGSLEQKQNVFDDFVACAEWLIDQGYTQPGRLAIQGGSNGGLLVAACMVQRPELFGAVIPAVGVLDMLRFHRFTIGWAWVSDYGSPEDPEQFAVLRAYSPYHNLKPGVAYPPTLIMTADHDDRVVPAHSFKFAAALQEAQGGQAPVLIRIQTGAGHGMGKPTRMILDEQADLMAFLWQHVGRQSRE